MFAVCWRMFLDNRWSDLLTQGGAPSTVKFLKSIYFSFGGMSSSQRSLRHLIIHCENQRSTPDHLERTHAMVWRKGGTKVWRPFCQHHHPDTAEAEQPDSSSHKQDQLTTHTLQPHNASWAGWPSDRHRARLIKHKKHLPYWRSMRTPARARRSLWIIVGPGGRNIT